MNADELAGMVLGVTFFLVTGGVLLLRPITKRLGSFLEVLAEERRRALAPAPQPQQQTDEARLVNVLEILDRRLARLEERQAFTDELLANRKPSELQSRSE